MQLFPSRSLKSMGFAISRVLVLVYVLFGFLLYLRQDAYLFYPPMIPMEECADLPGAEVIVSGGTRAYYIESGTSTKLAVIYHGNAESACDSGYLANWLPQYGYNVLVVEYAGYGGDNTKKPSVQLLLQDVRNIDAWVKKRNFSELLIIGRSIGSGFASHHASLASPEKLLLISPFDSLSRLATDYYPVYPMSFMLKTELDNIANASLAKEVLIIHGTKDDVIPLAHGKSLYEALPQVEKFFLPIPVSGHNDVLGTKESWSAIHSFLK